MYSKIKNCDAEQNSSWPAVNTATRGELELFLCQHHTDQHGPDLAADGWNITPVGQPFTPSASPPASPPSPPSYPIYPRTPLFRPPPSM